MFELSTYAVYLLLFSVGALIVGSIATLFTKSKKAAFSTNIALLVVIVIASTYLLISGYNVMMFNVLHIYAFSSLFIMFFAVTMALVHIISYANSNDYVDLSLLLALSFTSMFVIAASSSILGIFLGLELLAISTAFMILFEGKHRIEAAVKFFILSSISIATFAFALALLFPYNPQLTLTAASTSPNIAGSFAIILSIIMFAAAFGFDTALFPFNFWIPDVYEGASTHITALLAGINKKVAFVALIEVFFLVFFAYRSTFSPIFTGLAILTMFFGNLIALSQKSVKRLFAYSSISQAGYILIGIAAATQYGLEASIFYIIAHAFMIIGAFSIVLWLESKNIKTIQDYTGLNSRNKFAAASLAIIMLSMAGIPPLIGFAGKFLLFSSAISANIVLLAVIGIINSFISIYYYARVINSMYSKKSASQLKMDPYIFLVVALCVIVIIVFGIYPQPFIELASKASSALLVL
jgi:F420H2 dehydrogenase subunit N